YRTAHPRTLAAVPGGQRHWFLPHAGTGTGGWRGGRLRAAPSEFPDFTPRAKPHAKWRIAWQRDRGRLSHRRRRRAAGDPGAYHRLCRPLLPVALYAASIGTLSVT